jgi:transposase
MIRKVMEAIYPSVGGLDVHEATLVSCRRRLIEGGMVELEVKTFRSTTAEIRALAGWLHEWKVTHVAMESTGIYWVAVWNVLEDQFKLLLANAQHLKKVPGRKDDVPDAEWIAQCMQCGLLRPSFVPSAEVRGWRQLTRQRIKLSDQRTMIINRLHSVLEQGNIKLAQVASNIVGVSGRAIIAALSRGEKDATKLAALARGRLAAKYWALVESLDGNLNDNQRWLLKRLLEQLRLLEQEITVYDDKIKEQLLAYEKQVQRLDTIGGIARKSAEDILAEIGPNMDQFPTAENLVSWAALCPGKNRSAGKERSSKTPKGNRWLKRVLTEAAWAAVHQKGSYLAGLYRRLAPRRGKKRAIIAVARTILQAAWHILKQEVDYRDLGDTYFERLNKQKTASYLTTRLEKLGYQVKLKPVERLA